jgi:hypothetical protein
VIRIKNQINRSTLGFLFSFIAMLLWFQFILTTEVSWINPSNIFGLAQTLPLYTISLFLGLTGILYGLETDGEKIFICKILGLSLIIWGTINLIEPYPRDLDSYNFMLLSNKYMIGQTSMFFQWPGSYLLTIVLMKVVNLNALHYLAVFPLLFSSFFFLVYYIWVRRQACSRVVARLSAILVLLLNIWLQFHACAQAFALNLAIVFLYFFERSRNSAASKIGAILCWISLVIIHPILSSALTIFLMSFLVMSRVPRRNTKLLSVLSSFLSLIIIEVTWWLYASSFSFPILIESMAFVLREEELATTVVSTSATPALIFIPSLIRTAFL